MSAYVHAYDHIDLLVSLAVKTETFLYVTSPTNPDGTPTGLTTSHGQSLTASLTPTDLGRLLLAQNTKSVRHLYPTVDDSPEGIEYDLEISGYEFAPVVLDDETFDDISWAVAGIKALHGYTYQASEDDGWETSAAHQWVQAITSRVHNYLPGYDEADTWSFTRPVTQPRRPQPARP